MGHYTDFYGKLEFTRKLTDEEFALLEEIIYGPFKYRMEVCSDYCRKHLNNWDNDRDNREMHKECDAALKARGFIGASRDAHYANHLRVSDDKTGLVYCAEKTYDIIAGVKFIIVNARERIPGFGLKGSLFASTEFEPYTWLVKINDEGSADQEKCDWGALWDHDRKAYLEHLELQLYWRRKEAEREEDPRTSFRRAADLTCDAVEKVVDRWIAQRIRRAQRKAQQWRYRFGSVPKF